MTFITRPASIEDVAANQTAAHALELHCPKCGERAEVFADHHQATRQQPCRFLGVSVHCSCDPTFLEGRPLVGSLTAEQLAAPVIGALDLAMKTPDPCEGSRGHQRFGYAGELDRDHEMASERDPRVLELYQPGETFESIHQSCEVDALNALLRWAHEDAEDAMRSRAA